jgi:hypothetical protein
MSLGDVAMRIETLNDHFKVVDSSEVLHLNGLDQVSNTTFVDGEESLHSLTAQYVALIPSWIASKECSFKQQIPPPYLIDNVDDLETSAKAEIFLYSY